jgi:hypothetical protein
MSASVDPDLALPENPPVVTKAWVNGSGETQTQEWSGERTDCEAKYEELKSLGSAGGNISQHGLATGRRHQAG